MPTPTNPTPEGEWRPFTTKGVPIDAEYRIEGRKVRCRLRSAPYLAPTDLDLRLEMYDRGCRCDSCVKAYSNHRDATIALLADLLDGVLADDPQAIRDAALWLTVNRPEVTS